MKNVMFVVMVVGGLLAVAPAQADDSGTVTLGPIPDALTATSLFEAPACAAPNYGAYQIQAACPSCPRPCCQNVWDGYCSEKRAGWIGFPCVGLPGRCRSCGPGAGCGGCAVQVETGPATPDQATPPAAPAPEPAPEPNADQAPRQTETGPRPNAEVKPLPSVSSEPLRLPQEPAPTSAQRRLPVFNPSAWSIGRFAP